MGGLQVDRSRTSAVVVQGFDRFKVLSRDGRTHRPLQCALQEIRGVVRLSL